MICLFCSFHNSKESFFTSRLEELRPANKIFHWAAVNWAATDPHTRWASRLSMSSTIPTSDIRLTGNSPAETADFKSDMISELTKKSGKLARMKTGTTLSLFEFDVFRTKFESSTNLGRTSLRLQTSFKTSRASSTCESSEAGSTDNWKTKIN